MAENRKRLEAFNDNPKVKAFHFTEDGTPFANRGDAQNQATALKRAGRGTGKIEPITREQGLAMLAEEQKAKGQEPDSKNQEPKSNVQEPKPEVVLTPKQLAEKTLNEAIAARDQAKKNLDAAIETKAGLTADAAPADKTKATKAVNTASYALDAAEAAVVDAQAAFDALPAEEPQA